MKKSKQKTQNNLTIQSNSIGRSRSMTEATVRKLELCFMQGLTDKSACEIAHIPRSTFYYSMKHNQDFADRIKFAKAFLANQAGKRLLKIIMHGSNGDAIKLIKFVLERHDPENWSKKRTVNITTY